MAKEPEKPKTEEAAEAEGAPKKPGPARRRILIVGAGQTGRALVRVLSDIWEISVLDSDPEKLEKLREEMPDRPVQFLARDGTSLISLREAGLDGAEWVAALTDIDEVNIEICRLALTAQNPPSAIGILRQPGSAEKLKEIGAEALIRPGAIAGLVKNRIERAHQVAVSVGLGRGEIVEIPVLPSSPAVNVRVRDLRARRWLVGAIFRGDRFVVPHGHVVVREGDRLLLTGDPDILPHIADYLRAGVARFPLQYGTRVVAVAGAPLPDGYWKEVEYISTQTRTRALEVLAPPSVVPPKLDLDRMVMEVSTLSDPEKVDALRRTLATIDCGCLVLPKRPVSWLNRVGLTRPAFAKLMDHLSFPVLLAAGSHPYRRLLLPVTGSEGTLLAAEMAIDLSRQLDLQIAAILVAPPTFIVGHEIIQEQKDAMKSVTEIAALYHVKLEQVYKEGNPALEIAQMAGSNDLLVIAHRAGRPASLFNPDTSLQIMVRCPSSVLALSYREISDGSG